MQVTTEAGVIHQGYEQNSRLKDVFLRPLGLTETIRIPRDQIRTHEHTGSAMPTGLTAGLKQEELRDLIHFLTEQGRN